jgi:Asp-tRNA(Asn)/Glu-tRNA(Gln) amidotransferase A subunit family amidase
VLPCAIGGDGGGSIRIPAAYTGLVGLKATFGRIPRGTFEFRDWFDTISRGPLTRCVRDTALWLDAVAGYDPTDPDSLHHDGPAFTDGLDDVPRVRVAYLPTLGYGHVAPTCAVRPGRREGARERARRARWTRRQVHLTDVGLAWAFINTFQTYGRIASFIDAIATSSGAASEGRRDGRALGAVDIARCQQERYRLNVEVASSSPATTSSSRRRVRRRRSAAGHARRHRRLELASPLHAVAFTYRST